MPQFTGGPSIRVTSNTSIEVEWITDVAWFGKIEVFTDAAGATPPIVTKECLDGALNRVASTNQDCVVPIGPVLQANTQYYVRVTVSDPTQTNADFANPVPVAAFSGMQAITSVTPPSVTTSSATVSWTANVAGFGKVAYGTNGLTQTMQDAFNITDHAIQLQGLTAGTAYQFQVSNRHAIDGDDLVTATGQFTTAAQPPATTPVSFTEPHAEPRVINVGQTSSVSIRTKDGNGAIVSGVQCTFAIDGASAGAGTLSATQATTDANGIATVSFTGSARGLVKLMVTAANASNSPHQIPVVVK
ncbi:MAG TPA: Ig-like domain-containing protein [Kofleriaceae bacterium]|nr:Ig-like domain-containing protein [Kofleriaceae bacterium]